NKVSIYPHGGKTGTQSVDNIFHRSGGPENTYPHEYSYQIGDDHNGNLKPLFGAVDKGIVNIYFSLKGQNKESNDNAEYNPVTDDRRNGADLVLGQCRKII